MILRDSSGDPVVFTIEVVRDPYLPYKKQLVSGSLYLLGEPREERESGGNSEPYFSDDPIGLVFVPEYGQEVKS